MTDRSNSSDAGPMRWPMLFGWPLAAAALFYFNPDDRWDVWGFYYFGSFFMGVLANDAVGERRSSIGFWLYVLLMEVALVWLWRPRLAVALATGLLLWVVGKTGWLARWPSSRIVGYLGRISYSLFLFHFPVYVMVSAYWARSGYITPEAGLWGMLVAYVLSLGAAALFYQTIEVPTMRLCRKIR